MARVSGIHLRLLIPLLAGGVVCVFIGAAWLLRTGSIPAQEVTDHIHDLALQRSDNPARDDGGAIGPWWVTASSLDTKSGRLTNFRISSGEMQVAARTARLSVDPDQDTFSFDLHGVVITRFPEEEGEEHDLLALDQHTLGPIEYGLNIVP